MITLSYTFYLKIKDLFNSNIIFHNIFFLVFFLASTSFANTTLPLSETDYKYLIKVKMGEIEDLKLLWEWRDSNKGSWSSTQDIYIGGGILRGLLKWIHLSLQEGTFESVMETTPPNLNELINTESDKDLFIFGLSPSLFRDGNRGNNVSTAGNIGLWDLLEQGFSGSSLQSGGATIEKSGVNPDFIYDPSHGITDFINGILSYVDVPETKFKRGRRRWFFRGGGDVVKNNLKTILFLRFLRFQYELPFLKISPVTKEELIASLAQERIPENNGFVVKALKKLSAAANYDLYMTAQDLDKYGVASKLSAAGYSLEGQMDEWGDTINHNIMSILNSSNLKCAKALEQ